MGQLKIEEVYQKEESSSKAEQTLDLLGNALYINPAKEINS